MAAEALTAGGLPDKTQAVPGGVPVLTCGAQPAAVRVFPGLAEQTAQVRRWVRAVASRPGGSDLDDLALIATELFANAVLHTRSGHAGGKVTVAVTADGVVHIHDYGTAGPCPGLAGGQAADRNRREDFGHGLKIVAALSAGVAHLPAAWCPVAGPDDPAAWAGGCCICCRPGPAVHVTPAQEQNHSAMPALREGSNRR